MAPEVGTEAPDFTVKDQNNQDVTLSSFRGDRAGRGIQGRGDGGHREVVTALDPSGQLRVDQLHGAQVCERTIVTVARG